VPATCIVGNQVFGSRKEVVEHVLLFLEHALLVPGLAILAAAAQVGKRKPAACWSHHAKVWLQ